jgi:hypothetical protein
MSPRAAFLVLCGLSFPTMASGQGVSIDHQAVGCVLAEKFPRFDARLEPAEAVARARVNFRPEGTAHWYAVEMKPEAGVFHGILPKPLKTLHRFSYYIDVTDKAFHANRTAEFVLDVASGPAACGREKVMAAGLSKANVLLHGPEGVVGAPAVPAGFAADGVVTAGTAGTAAGTSAGTAGGLGAKAAIIGGVIAAGGAAAVVAATSGGSDTPSTPAPPATTTPAGPPPTTLPAPSPPPAATLTGTWVGNRPGDGMVLTFAGCGGCPNSPNGGASDMVLNLSQSGSALSGNLTLTTRESFPAGCPADPNCTKVVIGEVITYSITGTVSGTSVTMQFTGASGTMSGTVSGNRMTGNLTGTSSDGTPITGTWSVNLQ